MKASYMQLQITDWLTVRENATGKSSNSLYLNTVLLFCAFFMI
jgi:hypothetical protein